jgi:hypothetical protein
MFNVKKMSRYITNINDHKSHLFYVNGYNIIVKASPHYANGCQGPLLTILHTSTYEQTFSWENKFATNIILSRGIRIAERCSVDPPLLKRQIGWRHLALSQHIFNNRNFLWIIHHLDLLISVLQFFFYTEMCGRITLKNRSYRQTGSLTESCILLSLGMSHKFIVVVISCTQRTQPR